MLNNLQKRVFTALLIFPFIVSIILYSNDVVIRIFLNIIIFISSFEISKMCFYNTSQEISNKKHYYFIASIFISIFISNILIKNSAWIFLIIPSVLFWLYIIFYLANIKIIDQIKMFNIFYFFTFLLVISSFYCSLYTIYLYSHKALIYLISIVAIGDISAFFIGKKFGKNPFFKVISPNKTKEGFIGSLIICLLAALGYCLFENYDLNFIVKVMFLTFFTVLVSAFGDLFISLIKRRSGKKDTGNILPGHGGILDRVDGLLAAAPVFLIFSYFLSAIIQ